MVMDKNKAAGWIRSTAWTICSAGKLRPSDRTLQPRNSKYAVNADAKI
jgi:hypothetical protein